MPDLGVSEIIGIGSALAGGIGTVASLAKGSPKQSSGSILQPIGASTDLQAAPGVQHNPIANALQLPSLNLQSQNQAPKFDFGGSLNSDLLKTLGSMGGF